MTKFRSQTKSFERTVRGAEPTLGAGYNLIADSSTVHPHWTGDINQGNDIGIVYTKFGHQIFLNRVPIRLATYAETVSLGENAYFRA